MRGQVDFSVLGLKLPDMLAYQLLQLFILGAALIGGHIAQLVQQLLGAAQRKVTSRIRHCDTSTT